MDDSTAFQQLTRRTAKEELHLRSTRAVAHSDGTSEGDEVTGSDVVLGDEWLLESDDLVKTDVGVEGSLDRVEDDDGAISASATASTLENANIDVNRCRRTRTCPEPRGPGK